jgi:hypothetical protein
MLIGGLVHRLSCIADWILLIRFRDDSRLEPRDACDFGAAECDASDPGTENHRADRRMPALFPALADRVYCSFGLSDTGTVPGSAAAAWLGAACFDTDDA